MAGNYTPRCSTIKQRCQALGNFGAYVQLRESLKRQGMAAREAAERAYSDLHIEQMWQDHRQRQTQATILGMGAPLTPTEMKTVNPSYTPPTPTSGAEVGGAMMSLPEQIRWVKQQLARVRNGGEAPAHFPNADALYWYQIAATRPQDFDKIVLKIEAPDKDAEDVLMRDGEHQFAEIERQIKEAVEEVGKQLVVIEAGFSEIFHAALSAGAQGSGVEPAVPA